jgi:hypothetical protein
LFSDYSQAGVYKQDVITDVVNTLNQDKVRCYHAKGFQWTDLGLPQEKPRHGKERIQEIFRSCFVRDCVSFFEGKLYHCARTYALENMGIALPETDEVIDFGEIRSKDELIEKMKRFYGLQQLSACAYCKDAKERKEIPAAIQIK